MSTHYVPSVAIGTVKHKNNIQDNFCPQGVHNLVGKTSLVHMKWLGNNAKQNVINHCTVVKYQSIWYWQELCVVWIKIVKVYKFVGVGFLEGKLEMNIWLEREETEKTTKTCKYIYSVYFRLSIFFIKWE